MNGAVQLLAKAAEEGGKRVIRGIASTGREDRMLDVVVPRGLKYQLPFPFLLFHDHAAPVGVVTSATVTDTDFRITAEIARDVGRANEAWELCRSGICVGLSIGFRGLTYEPNGTKGLRWTSAELLEVSLVSIAANPDCRVVSTSGKALPSNAVKLITGDSMRGAVKLIRGNR